MHYDGYSFSDGNRIDWFVWEPVSTAQLLTPEGLSLPLSSSHWLTTIFGGREPILLELPISRSTQVTRVLNLVVPCTVQELLEQIREFYWQKIPPEDALEDVRMDVYKIEVQRHRQTAVWLDLLGTPRVGYEGYEDQPRERRPWWWCNGRLIYEGLHRVQRGRYQVECRAAFTDPNAEVDRRGPRGGDGRPKNPDPRCTVQ